MPRSRGRPPRRHRGRSPRGCRWFAGSRPTWPRSTRPRRFPRSGCSPAALRAVTFSTLIGLMAATGLRTGEAVRLDRGDVDLDAGLLLIRYSKYGKSRRIPLHPTTLTALADYTRRRDQLCPRPGVPAFLLVGKGERLSDTTTGPTFRRLLAQVGITVPPGRRRPRLHDLRHTFAVTVPQGFAI